MENAELYYPLNPGFAPACEYLRRTDFSALAHGRHEIDGDRLFVMINRVSGRGREGAKFESHRRYIDIQYTIAGPDEIGWKAVPECRQVEMPYDSQKDMGLFGDTPEIWVSVPPGHFAIFFPEDAHAPLGAPTIRPLVKAVMKIAVDWR
ncbi:MAG: YhcH/YjgK/YiaL family protein [Planctomycetes bacterium]|nr:YhcH/YjgK/YiaL family protein [Planctomycetota bacterium]